MSTIAPRPVASHGPQARAEQLVSSPQWFNRPVLDVAVAACPLAFFLSLQLLLPLRTTIQIGPDEGYEVAKATLCLKGHALYTEIWNDQPPLHTFLLTCILKHLSPSILGPRLISVAAAAVLLTSIFLISLRLCNLWVAAITAFFLIASPGFLELSASCMVEMPAVAAAVAALCLLIAGPRIPWPLTALLAGVMLGTSLQIKFITLVLLPIAGLAFCLQILRDGHRLRSLWPEFLVFFMGLGTTFFLINWLAGGGSFLPQLQQSWAAHFAPTRSFEYGSPADRPFDWGILLRNWDLTLPALFALLLLVPAAGATRRHPPFAGAQSRRNARDNARKPGRARVLTFSHTRFARRSHPSMVPNAKPLPASGHFLLASFPFIWLALTLAVFGLHRPWWPCYYLHNAVPLCWCAAIGVNELRERAYAQGCTASRVALVLYAGIALLWSGARLHLEVTDIQGAPKIYSSLVLKEMDRLRPFADWLYTDEPIYSFHSGIPMPPSYAVVALKRFWSGDMTNARMAGDMRALKPSVILLGNNARQVPFQDLLNEQYFLVYFDAAHRLYARKDVAAKAAQATSPAAP